MGTHLFFAVWTVTRLSPLLTRFALGAVTLSSPVDLKTTVTVSGGYS